MRRVGSIVAAGVVGMVALTPGCRFDSAGPDGLVALCGMHYPLALDNTAGDTTLEAIPILVRLHASQFDVAIAAENGASIRFYDQNGTMVPHEIERWDPVGESLIWVRATSIAAAAVDSMALEIGRETAPGPLSTAEVWSNGYVGVWHFADDSMTDSSGNGHHGTAAGGASTQPGWLGNSLEVDGSGDYVDVASSAALNLSTMTLEAWARFDGTPDSTWGAIVEHDRNGDGWYGLWKADGVPKFHFRYSGGSVPGSHTVNWQSELGIGEWQHIVATRELSGEGRLFQDGVLDAEFKAEPPVASDGEVVIGGIGTNPRREFFTGEIDELRISNVPRSAAWVDVQYRSMMNALVTIGERRIGPCD